MASFMLELSDALKNINWGPGLPVYFMAIGSFWVLPLSILYIFRTSLATNLSQSLKIPRPISDLATLMLLHSVWFMLISFPIMNVVYDWAYPDDVEWKRRRSLSLMLPQTDWEALSLWMYCGEALIGLVIMTRLNYRFRSKGPDLTNEPFPRRGDAYWDEELIGLAALML